MNEEQKKELIGLIETLSTTSEDLGYNLRQYYQDDDNEVIDAIKGFKSQIMSEIIDIIRNVKDVL